jgi:molybdopterin synthase catalytic subunit
MYLPGGKIFITFLQKPQQITITNYLIKTQTMNDKKLQKTFLVEGAITAESIAKSIANHSTKKSIGAHSIFLGQVRADEINNRTVVAIDFTAYAEMAEKQIELIREEIIIEHKLTCAHVKHSLGKLAVGEICFFVFVSSPHRKAAIEACNKMVERIKKEVPIFGKEIFENETYQWKENKA